MSPDPLTLAAAEQARNVALQMMAERGRGEVLVGIAHSAGDTSLAGGHASSPCCGETDRRRHRNRQPVASAIPWWSGVCAENGE